MSPAPCALAVNRLAGVGWRVDYTLCSSLLRSVEEPVVHLQLEVAGAPGARAQPVAMVLSADKFQVLLAGKAALHLGAQSLPHLADRFSLPLFPTELKQAQALMSTLG